MANWFFGYKLEIKQMIYGIKATVENLHSKHICKALKNEEISYLFVSIGEEPSAGCDVFIDEKDESQFVYVKTEGQLDSEQLKNIVSNAMSNYLASDYYNESELALMASFQASQNTTE